MIDPAISGQLAALLGIEVAQTDAMLLGLQAVAQATREPPPPRGLVGRQCTMEGGDGGTIRAVVTPLSILLLVEREDGTLSAVPYSSVQLQPIEAEA